MCDARGQPAIQQAIDEGWLCVWPDEVPRIDLPDLDEGEAACIAIAAARMPDSLSLIDERAGRAVAAQIGIKIAGTAAMIGQARMRGLVGSARQVFERLHRSDFRISQEVIRTVLQITGE